MNYNPTQTFVVLVATTLLLSTLGAQTASPSTSASRGSATSSPADETVVLSPFVVQAETDYGYQATSSLSGGRLATDLKDTAVAVSVLTRELLDDIGANDAQSALMYATNSFAGTENDVNPEGGTGAQATGSGGAAGGGNSLRVRAIRDATATLDYFNTSFNADSYNIERIDISRGPNALLFGDSSTGGSFNVGTKRALSRPITRMSVRTSTFGGARGSLDINRPLSKSVALRINLLDQNTTGFRDYSRNRRLGAALAATWRINNSTEIRAQGEWGKMRVDTPAAFIRDNAAGWDHLTTISTLGQTVTTATQGLAATTANLVMNLAHPEFGFYTLNGTRRTVVVGNLNSLPLATELPVPALGLPFPITQTAPIDAPALLNGVKVWPVVPSYTYSSRATLYRRDEDYYAATVTFDKRIGQNLFLEFAAHTEELERNNWAQLTNQVYYDVMQIIPVGAATGLAVSAIPTMNNPDFLKPYLQGEARIVTSHPRNHEARAMAVYQLNTKWFNQRIGVLATRRVTNGDTIVYRMTRTNNPTQPNLGNVANVVVVRTNLDQPGLSGIDYELNRVYTDAAGVNVAYKNYTGSGAATAFDTGTTSYQVFASGSWLPSKRLYTTLGIRRDYYHEDDYAAVRDASTTELVGFAPPTTFENRVDNPSAGVVLHILPQLSLYASRSKSFVPAAGRQTYIQTPAPLRRGVGTDYGVKFSLFGNRITGSLGYYDTNEENNQVGSPTVVAAMTSISRTLVGFNEPTIDLFTDTQTAAAHGYELDITANLTKNWSLVLNGGLPKSTLSNALPYSRLLLDNNRDRWVQEATTLVNNGTDPNALTTVNNQIISMEGAFASFADGRPVSNVRNYRANVFTRYRFSQGFLKGFGIGGGVQFYGRNFVTTVSNQNIYASGYHVVDALLNYDCKLFGKNTKFQLNVRNVLNSVDFQYVNYFATTTAANGFPNNFRVNVPREFQFSVDVNF
ncbi:exported hypothetical protein [uncultured Defluviicoccus sp.]|uniref:TonB-dependent receptor n=1 Tax=metagenome TaxID=256318 RepID=A0A380TFZ8_9ZZZZ|nr:exported hypothetical protein [uncultured Defluviicoccus sp.]